MTENVKDSYALYVRVPRGNDWVWQFVSLITDRKEVMSTAEELYHITGLQCRVKDVKDVIVYQTAS